MLGWEHRQVWIEARVLVPGGMFPFLLPGDRGWSGLTSAQVLSSSPPDEKLFAAAVSVRYLLQVQSPGVILLESPARPVIR